MHRSSEGSVLTAGGSGWVNRRLITVAEPQLTSDCDRMTNILSEILRPVKTPGQNTLVLQLICSTWVLMDGPRVHCWWFWSKVSLKLEPTLSRQMILPWKFSPKFVSFFMIKKIRLMSALTFYPLFIPYYKWTFLDSWLVLQLKYQSDLYIKNIHYIIHQLNSSRGDGASFGLGRTVEDKLSVCFTDLSPTLCLSGSNYLAD